MEQRLISRMEAIQQEQRLHRLRYRMEVQQPLVVRPIQQRHLNVHRDSDLAEMTGGRLQRHVVVERCNSVPETPQHSNAPAEMLQCSNVLAMLRRSNVPAMVLHIKAGRGRLLLIVKGEQVNRHQHNEQDMHLNVQVERVVAGRNREDILLHLSVQEEGVLVVRRGPREGVRKARGVQEERVREGVRPRQRQKRVNVEHQSSKRNQRVRSHFRHRSW
jgi:hypothetical protein